nr:hypothetical protein [uncultured bacterium]AIA12965.1 Unknown Function [uncultured bacterium]
MVEGQLVDRNFLLTAGGVEIATGVDSRVIRVGSDVYKLYDQNFDTERFCELTLEDILRYQGVMNEASESLAEAPFSMSVPLNNLSGITQEYPVSFSVLPIDEVGEVDGIPFGRSRYIAGPNLAQLFTSYKRYLPDPELTDEQNDFFAVNRPDLNQQWLDVLNASPVPIEDNVVSVIWQRRREINAYLRERVDGVKGVAIGIDNIKASINPDLTHLHLIITDLYNEIRREI